ncbi:MAG: FGGY family carbohydrate kinase, partial [Halioglobus sp.]|nr:FGGY family carbohydrate kinase [Halioglobus sp.]
MNKQWLMGIDLGGSGVRCLLLDSSTRSTVECAQPWRFSPAPGTFGTGFDLDLDELWRTVGAASREALLKAGIEGGQVAALAISAMRFSTVVVDAQGKALLAVPNSDARAAGECFEIAEQYGAALVRDTGSPALPLHASARLRWLQNQQPGSLENVASVYGCGEWLVEQLTGVRAIDPSQGSASGLFSLHEADWAWDLVDEMALPRTIFPPVVTSGTALGTLTATAADHLGLSTETVVGMGGGDTQCSLLGAGTVERGQCAVVAGTTAPVQVVADTPVIDDSGAMIAAHHVVPGRWVLESSGGPMGFSISTLARILFPGSTQAEAQLFAEASRSETGAAGMLSTFGADLMNMGAPSMPMGTITLSHMGCSDDPQPRRHLARAVVEGCACAVKANRDRLEGPLAGTATTLQADTLTLCGGLSRSDTFGQVLADIADLEIAVPEVWQTSALGAALCAGVAAGTWDDLSAASAAISASRRRFSPREEQRQDCDQLYASWQRLRQAAETGTDPVAVDHLLPRVLREPDTGAGAHGAAVGRLDALVTAAFGDASLDTLRNHMDVEYASFREAHRLLTGPDLVRELQGRQVFVTEVDVVDAAALKELPDLRVVAACRGDAVNVDVEACTAFGIPVLFAPGRNAVAVADLAVGFMISLARKLPDASQF